MNKYKEGWSSFIELCLATQDPKTLVALFNFLFTPEEKENLAARYLITRELLLDEKPQRQIAKELEVSIAKITRGSNALKHIDKKLLDYLLDKLARRNNI
jgi:TrpR family trp operon transcriptional repressor